MEIGERYNWINQRERLIYKGHNFSGNGYWHQFVLVDSPDKIWCECLTSELSMIEETKLTPDVQLEIDRLADGLHKLWDTQKDKHKENKTKTERNRRKRARKAAKSK